MKFLLIVGLFVVLVVVVMAASGNGGSVKRESDRAANRAVRKSRCQDCGVSVGEKCPKPGGPSWHCG